MLNRLWRRKSVRFICVGFTNTVIDFTILNILVSVCNFHPVIANVFSASVSILISYFLNHHVVFHHHEAHSLQRFARFIAVTALGVIAIQSLVIELVNVVLGHIVSDPSRIVRGFWGFPLSLHFIDLNVAKALAVAVGMAWNYVIYNKIVFRNHKPSESGVEDSFLG